MRGNAEGGMRWVAFRGSDGRDRIGRLIGDKVHEADGVGSLIALLGDDGEKLHRAGERAASAPAAVHDLGALELRPPIPQPPTIRDFYAFEQHVKAGRRSRGLDMIPEWYEIPVFYFTNPSALSTSGDAIAIPPGCQKMDFEVEVAAVIGQSCSNIPVGAAGRHIAGYMIMNDWSARDLQRKEMLVGLGPAKGKDFAMSIGPEFVTADEIEARRRAKGFDLAIRATVNGREYSAANFADIYWSFEEMLSFAARGTNVLAGDILGSGTCGTGCIAELSLTHGEDKFPWLKPGDAVEITVEGLGSLRNTIVAGPPLHPLR
jgi:2-keto-4-pentenoate hydratase/2-oxohepta-3-ene-1,7-dioic acid hydratase in catechol pathway